MTTDPAPDAPLLDVRDLCVWFPGRGRSGVHRAVDGVSLTLRTGETLGLVGESGCGKTTVGRAIMRLERATSGSVSFLGRDVLAMGRRPLHRLRRDMQMIFQDPFGSLNPRLRVGRTIGEPLLVHGLARGDALREQVAVVLERCGLWRGAADRYPHEFSGGQRQRIAIARALILQPRLIVCDEPTSALDVSIQSQVLNLLQDLQAEFGLAYLFISHDMAVIDHMCDRVAVMHEGHIVETGSRQDVIHDPQHPYTQSLLAAVPGV